MAYQIFDLILYSVISMHEVPTIQILQSDFPVVTRANYAFAK